MKQMMNRCPSCGMRRNPAYTLCPKCDKADFLGEVKNGMNPFDHMSAARVIWIAVLAMGLSAVVMTVAAVGVMTYELATGEVPPTQTLDVQVLIETNYPSLLLVSSLIGQILATLVVCVVAGKYLPAILCTFKNYKNILKSAAVSVVVMALSAGWNTFCQYVLGSATNENQMLVENEILQFPVIAILTTVIGAPLLEELTFRCGIFGLLRRKNFVVALIVSCLLFTLIHLNPGSENLAAELFALPGYLLLGVSLGLVYHKYGFAGSVTAHALNNLGATILILAFG